MINETQLYLTLILFTNTTSILLTYILTKRKIQNEGLL